VVTTGPLDALFFWVRHDLAVVKNRRRLEIATKFLTKMWGANNLLDESILVGGGPKLIVLKPSLVHIPLAVGLHRLFFFLVGGNAEGIDAVRICEKGVPGGVRINILPAGFLPPTGHQVHIPNNRLRWAVTFGLVVLSEDAVYRVRVARARIILFDLDRYFVRENG